MHLVNQVYGLELYHKDQALLSYHVHKYSGNLV